MSSVMGTNPYETLGITPGADQEEIRSAYRARVKLCHPDMIREPEARKEAQERMVQLNLAYEEALRLAGSHHPLPPAEEVPLGDALIMAERMLNRGNPESALRQLLRAEERDASWYAVQGKVLMAMEQYDSAHQSYREAIRRDPENNAFRAGALDAAVSLKKQQTVGGKLKKFWRDLKK